jgi:hypothetical protein
VESHDEQRGEGRCGEGFTVAISEEPEEVLEEQHIADGKGRGGVVLRFQSARSIARLAADMGSEESSDQKEMLFKRAHREHGVDLVEVEDLRLRREPAHEVRNDEEERRGGEDDQGDESVDQRLQIADQGLQVDRDDEHRDPLAELHDRGEEEEPREERRGRA